MIPLPKCSVNKLWRSANMSKRDKKYVECPICREEVKLAEQRCFTGSHIAFPDLAELDDLFAVIRKEVHRKSRPDSSTREFIHWACNNCLKEGRALLAKPKDQHFRYCWPYYVYFSARFSCPHCKAGFTFDKRAQFTRYEVEKQWVQAWPQYCRACDHSRLSPRFLQYAPVF
jgi:hypothetical protein